MATTGAPYLIPYYATSDASNYPAQGQAQALAIHAALAAIEAKTITARKTANETVNNTATLQNDDALFVTPAINTVYTVDSYIVYDAATAADLTFAFTFPAGASLSWAVIGLATSVTAVTGDMTAAARDRFASGVAGAIGAGGANVGGEVVAIIRGTLIMGATAGNLQLQWAQAVANASDAVVYRDSWLRLQKIT